MSREQLVNNTDGVLSANISSTATSLTVTVNDGAFPTSGNYVVRLSGSPELMLVTSQSGNVLQVVRGIEGTTASSHTAGEVVTVILSAGAMQRYGRDNDGYFDGARPPFALLDASGNVLTSASFTLHTGSGDLQTPVVADSDRRVRIKRPAGSGTGTGELETLLSRPAPSTPYTVTLAVQPCYIGDTAGRFCTAVGFRESSSGKSLLCRVPLIDGSRDEININTFLNESSSSFVTAIDYPLGDTVQWYQLTDDGTNCKFAWSVNGVDFIPIYSVARGTYFTSHPDSVVWGCGANSNPYDSFCSLLAWSGA